MANLSVFHFLRLYLHHQKQINSEAGDLKFRHKGQVKAKIKNQGTSKRTSKSNDWSLKNIQENKQEQNYIIKN